MNFSTAPLLTARSPIENQCSSKLDFQAKLHHTSRSGTGHLPEVACTELRVDDVEIRVIEGIKQLSSELDVDSIGGGESLEKRHVPVMNARTAQDVADRRCRRNPQPELQMRQY